MNIIYSEAATSKFASPLGLVLTNINQLTIEELVFSILYRNTQ